MDSTSVAILASKILKYFRDRPHEPVTRRELADALNVARYNTLFGMGLTRAREMAADAGACITSSSWSATIGAQAMRYLPDGDERHEALPPLVTSSAITLQYMERLKREADYSVRNAASPAGRAYAEMIATALDQAGKHFGRAQQMAIELLQQMPAPTRADADVAGLAARLADLDQDRGEDEAGRVTASAG